MKQRKPIFESIALSVQLPTESMPRLPIVELAGYRRVLIENHRGIMQYTACQICVIVSYGHIRICGAGLAIARMTKQQLVITGQIDSVCLNRR